jgi:hypothetical protein
VATRTWVVINDTMLTDGGWLVVELVMDEGIEIIVIEMW